MPRRLLILPLWLCGPALLAACDRQPDPPTDGVSDPVIAAALGEELMTDPDLVRQNPANAALDPGGPPSALMPLENRSAETIAAARAEALRLVGGKLQRAPAPREQDGTQPASGAGAITPAAIAARALAGGRSGSGCASRLEYSFGWAARLPAALPVYPRGHVHDAAGTDAEGCRLRVLTFVTPVTPADVIDFYWTRAGAAGIAVQHSRAGQDAVLDGGRDGGGFVLHARQRGGMTEVDLVTSGL